MDIREATKNDIPKILPLINQLGYPTTVEKLTERFTHILAAENYQTLVAVWHGEIVGFVGVCTVLTYEFDGCYTRIVAFVVDSNHRRRGIGKVLIQEAERWAKKKGAIGITLNSGDRQERKAAHQFYLSMGYEIKSVGFGKILT